MAYSPYDDKPFTHTSPELVRPSRWIYLPALPVAALMGEALVRDPGRVGDAGAATEMSLGVFVVIAGVVSALMVAVWALAVFRHRTAALLVQLVVVWVGGLLYVNGTRTHDTWWDVAEDAVLLLTTLLQLLPRVQRVEAGPLT